MSHPSDSTTSKLAGLPLADDVRRAIVKLLSLHDGEMGFIEVLGCGDRAIPALRAIVFAREPSGIYEPRRRAVEALARLGAYDVLIDFLSAPREIQDSVEQTGEEAVINAAAHAVSESNDPRVIPLLLALVELKPFTGAIEALGDLKRIDALPYFIDALAEDFARPAAEAAIRKIGPRARDALLKTATRSMPPDTEEPVSKRRQRRSALVLLAEIGPWPLAHRQILHGLIRDDDPTVAALACRICLAGPCEPAKDDAIARLLELLLSADALLTDEITDCLVTHYARARAAIAKILRHGVSGAAFYSPPARRMRALRRVMARAETN